MSDQNSVLSNQDGVLVGHIHILSSEKNYLQSCNHIKGPEFMCSLYLFIFSLILTIVYNF